MPARQAIRAPGASATRSNVGFLLAKASQRWNELLRERFVEAGFPEVRPSYGSLLLPLWEEDGLRMGELARRARLSKQTITTMVRLLERDGLVSREQDPADARASVVRLTARAREFKPVAEEALADLYEDLVDRLSDRRVAELAKALREVGEL
jgi:MarR family transcriptional regulator, organic hydroperoxide resistance regulator